MRLIQLGTLVTRCKERADMEGSDFVDDPEWKGYISTLYGQLHKKLVQSGLRYFESLQSIASADLTDNGDGGGYIALPNDYLGSLGVEYKDTAGNRTELWELMAQERGVYGGASSNTSESYAVVGQRLLLYPKPPSGQTYEHVYVPQPVDLASETSEKQVDVVSPDGEDFIIWGVARLALAKEESDTSVAEREWARASGAFDEAAQMRALLNMRRRQVDDGPRFYDPADYRRWGQ